MPDFDLLIRGAQLVTSGGDATTDIGITDGAFAVIGSNLGGTAGNEIDATGLLALPGGIDPHVHFNEPGRTDWEGWASGSAAAAAGGLTSVIEMPLNAHPPTVDGPHSVRSDGDDRRARAAARSAR
jgi:allantoinase